MRFHERKSIKFLQLNIKQIVYESKWSDKVAFWKCCSDKELIFATNSKKYISLVCICGLVSEELFIRLKEEATNDR
jgi:hypothetical protein